MTGRSILLAEFDSYVLRVWSVHSSVCKKNCRLFACHVILPRASFFFGVRIMLGTILGRFSIIYFRGLGLRIKVMVWVMVRARVRVWVRVGVGVGVRVSVVLWSW